jgi:hypothetical protein
MSPGTITPVTVPDGVGQAGFPPPPQKKTATPPFTCRDETWMCDWVTTPFVTKGVVPTPSSWS